ncbi:hypothetical protein P9112_004931 [Eukaryota sp. TZLM1-RC]
MSSTPPSLHDDVSAVVCNLNLSLRASPNEAGAIEFVEHLVHITSTHLDRIRAQLSELETAPSSTEQAHQIHNLTQLESFLKLEHETWLLWQYLLSNPPTDLPLLPHASPSETVTSRILSDKELQTLNTVKTWAQYLLTSKDRYTPDPDLSSIYFSVWKLLLSSQVDEAVSLLASSEHYLAAASLTGTQLEHVDGDGVYGNPDRIINRFSLRQLSKKSNNDYEKAIYGLLGGDCTPCLKVVESFYQGVFSISSVLIDNCSDLIMGEDVSKFRRYSAGIEEFLPPSTSFSVSKMIDLLERSPNSFIKKALKNPQILFQTLIMVNNDSYIINYLFKWLSELSHDSVLYGHLLRFGICVGLTMTLAGTIDTSSNVSVDKLEEISELYSNFLVSDFENLFKTIHPQNEQDKVNFLSLKFTSIAKFSSLVPSRSSQIFGKFLSVLPADLRSDALKLAESFQLDAQSVARNAAGFRQQSVDLRRTVVHDDVALRDTVQKCQEALSFLIVDRKQRGEAIISANQMSRSLIKNDRFESARSLLHTLPEDTDELMHHLWEELGQKPNEVNGLHEFHCLVSLTECYHLYNQWRKRSSKVTADQLISQIKSCLLIDGGFLIDVVDDFVMSERIAELESIRKRHVVELFFLLHSVLISEGLFSDCLKLADLISSSSYNYISLFSNEDLTKFLQFFANDALSAYEGRR